jgi:hypothetical protein
MPNLAGQKYEYLVKQLQDKATSATAAIAPEALNQHETMPDKKGRKIITLSDPSMPFTTLLPCNPQVKWKFPINE